MTRYAIGILLFLSAIQSSAQSSFTEKEWDTLSLRIVNMIAENKRLIADATIDKESLAAMNQGRLALEKAINECQTAMSKEGQISADRQALLSIANQALKELKGEIRRQKFLKWLGYAWAALATIAFTVVATK